MIRSKRLNSVLELVICLVLLSTALITRQGNVSAAADFSTSGGGSTSGYTVGNFTAALNYSNSQLAVTLTPKVSTATTTNLWYTNVSNPTALSQAVAGYSTGSKNSSGNYVVNISNPSIPSDGTIYLFLATNSGDTGWVKCNVYGAIDPTLTPTATPQKTPTPAITLSTPVPEPSSFPDEYISSNWINELGLGSVRTSPVINSNWAENDAPSTIYKTKNVTGAVGTNDWMSSVLWLPFSEPIYAHPLAYKFTKSGLKISMPPKQYSKDTDGDIEVIRRLDESVPGTIDFTVGAESFNPTDARADKLGDWSADVVMADGSKSIKSTIAHGSPFAYFTFIGCNPKVVFNTVPEVIDEGQSLKAKINGKYYGFFAPTGSTWSGIGTNTITCNLPSGKNYFSLAVLPSEEAFEFYKQRAYAFIVDTEVKWGYYSKDSSVVTTFKVATEVKEGTNTDTIFALYPHQWRSNSLISPLSYTYDSIRGNMKTVSGKMFQTRYTYNGILTNMPGVDKDDNTSINTLKQMVDKFEAEKIKFTLETSGSGFDTYWTGKTLNEMTQVLPIAEQVGDTVAAEKIEAAIKSKLEDFFSADSTETAFYDSNEKNNLFYYNSNWGTLIGYDASYGSQNELNDHHFHYGYFINAASQIALRDKEWAKNSKWGAMVKLLIKDIANYNKKDTRFPFLRNFDPYAGHSWASGHAKFTDGNNQESSSEAVNAWAGIIQWGEATGDSTIRDLGIYLYTTEVQAINNYWFDIYEDTRDEQYVNVDTSMIWGSKCVHTTWWTNDPIEVHGINWLPITGASLYLGTDSNYVKRNYDSIWKEWNTWLTIKPADQNSDPKLWQDILCSYYALYDPEAAISKWDESATSESGESIAHTYHWMQSLKTIGLPDFSVTSDTPLYSVFKNKLDNKKTYVVYNASDASKQVNFSDGMNFTANPNSMTVIKEGEYIPPQSVKFGDVNNDGSLNSIDYALMRSYLLGIIKDFPVENDLLVSDLNGDGKFNSIDFAYMRSYLLGMITVFPVENN
ncbi:glycosyl hydrolase [Acetivibrio cellulolyticus]|uniref:glycosyl hydrolase n=1 Tax=Acetivibrio cellulolyticus TaxID=35830 RepID=UPI0001E2E2CF|nr:glycosyl hydrolase [Acetivibrio cellulolyticus]